MLCLSHKGTANLIRKLTDDHDKSALQWRGCLRERIQVNRFVCWFVIAMFDRMSAICVFRNKILVEV